MKIFIIGAGTLGKLIAEIIESNNSLIVGGFYDDNCIQNNKAFEKL